MDTSERDNMRERDIVLADLADARGDLADATSDLEYARADILRCEQALKRIDSRFPGGRKDRDDAV